MTVCSITTSQYSNYEPRLCTYMSSFFLKGLDRDLEVEVCMYVCMYE